MTFDDWTDPEINKAVAVLEGLSIDNGYGFIDTDENLVCYYIVKPVNGEAVRVNFCKNPSDSWPIILENKISIEFRCHKSLDPIAKRFGSNSHNVVDPNPLRAAMIVYLMMKGVKPEDKP